MFRFLATLVDADASVRGLGAFTLTNPLIAKVGGFCGSKCDCNCAVNDDDERYAAVEAIGISDSDGDSDIAYRDTISIRDIDYRHAISIIDTRYRLSTRDIDCRHEISIIDTRYRLSIRDIDYRYAISIIDTRYRLSICNYRLSISDILRDDDRDRDENHKWAINYSHKRQAR